MDTTLDHRAQMAAGEPRMHRLDTPFRAVPSGQVQGRPDPELLKQTFSELARRSLELFADPRLKYPETVRLFQIAGEVLSLTRVAHRELERLGTPHAVLFNAQVVLDALDGMRRYLGYLTDQLRRLDTVANAALILHPLLKQLHESRTTDAAPLWELTREIAAESESATNQLPSVMPEGISLVNFLQRSFKPGQSIAIAEGLAAAHRVAWLTANLPGWRTRRELLVAAALLADCGFVTLCSTRQVTPEQFQQDDPKTFCWHPSVSAALAAGLAGAPLELPAIIGRHHQRLDGNGYPEGLSAHGYVAPARLLAIVCRLRELESIDTEHHAPMEPALARLKQEADAGAWDQFLVRQVVELLTPAASATSARPMAAPYSLATEVADPIRQENIDRHTTGPHAADQLRRDAAHPQHTLGRTPGSAAPRSRQTA